MYQTARLMFLVCESPTHPGIGSDQGYIDNPIQRESHTSFPKIESSSLKGALRERFERALGRIRDIDIAFGPENGDEHQGAMGFSNARLLLFPVKSMSGVFGWITCPMVLNEFLRTIVKADGLSAFELQGLATLNPDNNKVNLLSGDTNLKFKNNDAGLVLEEYYYTSGNPEKKEINVNISPTPKPLNDWLAETIYHGEILAFWKQKMKKDIVVVSDNDFRFFVKNYTEVTQHNKIDAETGTVSNGMLFSVENLPPDTILYSLVASSDEFKLSGKAASSILDDFFVKKLLDLRGYFQLGGKESLGKGALRACIPDIKIATASV